MEEFKVSGRHVVETKAKVRVWEPGKEGNFTLIVYLPNGERVWATVKPRAKKSFQRLEDFVEMVRDQENNK